MSREDFYKTVMSQISEQVKTNRLCIEQNNYYEGFPPNLRKNEISCCKYKNTSS